jgi:hypothetical protein
MFLKRLRESFLIEKFTSRAWARLQVGLVVIFGLLKLYFVYSQIETSHKLFQSSVAERVGGVMGNDSGFVRKVLKSNVCRIINNHGTQWRSWLRHWATSRNIAGSISFYVTDVILEAALWP